MQIGSQPKRKKKEIEENWEKIYWSTTCARAYTHAHYHRHAHTQSSTHSHAHAHTQTHCPSLSLVHTRGKEEGDSKKYCWEKSEKCQQSQISIFMTPGPSTRLSLFFRSWKKVGGEFFFLKTEASFGPECFFQRSHRESNTTPVSVNTTSILILDDLRALSSVLGTFIVKCFNSFESFKTLKLIRFWDFEISIDRRNIANFNI